jgi:hypothetical protein
MLLDERIGSLLTIFPTHPSPRLILGLHYLVEVGR